MNRKWQMFFLILLIATIIIQGYSIYVYATEIREPNGIWCYRVQPLDYIADDCWNLMDPDQYILEAIEDAEEWTEPFDYRDSSFWFIAPWRDHYNYTLHETLGRRPKPFLYNGTCYDYDVTYAGTYIIVKVLDEPPQQYWNLTNPDKRLLTGIKNLGKPILVPLFSDETCPHPFRYNETYYDYSITGYVDIIEYPFPKIPKPELTAIGLAGIWIITGSVYIVSSRKKRLNLNFPSLFFCCLSSMLNSLFSHSFKVEREQVDRRH